MHARSQIYSMWMNRYYTWSLQMQKGRGVSLRNNTHSKWNFWSDNCCERMIQRALCFNIPISTVTCFPCCLLLVSLKFIAVLSSGITRLCVYSRFSQQFQENPLEQFILRENRRRLLSQLGNQARSSTWRSKNLLNTLFWHGVIYLWLRHAFTKM